MFGKPNAGTRSKDVLFFVLMASSLAIGAGVANSALSAHECARARILEMGARKNCTASPLTGLTGAE